MIWTNVGTNNLFLNKKQNILLAMDGITRQIGRFRDIISHFQFYHLKKDSLLKYTLILSVMRIDTI